MIQCPNCQTEYPENTVFCDECGYYLPEGIQQETDPLAITGRTRAEREEMGEALGVDVTSPLGLKVTIPESGREVEVSLAKEVHIGRLNAVSGSLPDVDLTSDGGGEKGISRHHAKITRRGREVFIEDLGSMNGTFLNGRKLVPYRLEVLRSGDELQLGKLILRIRFTG